MDTKTKCGYEKFTDSDLVKAFCLMVRPEWMRDRDFLIAALKSFDYSPEDIKEVLDSGKPLHDGPYVIL